MLQYVQNNATVWRVDSRSVQPWQAGWWVAARQKDTQRSYKVWLTTPSLLWKVRKKNPTHTSCKAERSFPDGGVITRLSETTGVRSSLLGPECNIKFGRCLNHVGVRPKITWRTTLEAEMGFSHGAKHNRLLKIVMGGGTLLMPYTPQGAKRE